MDQQTISNTIQILEQKYGDQQRQQIEKGVKQIAGFWRQDDGSADDFSEFCRKQFIVDEKLLHETFERYETNLESIYGYGHEIQRDLSVPMQLDIGPILPVDYFFAEFDPFAHLDDDFFTSKIAFVALLNYPLYTLAERLKLGPTWSREQWAQARMVEKFASRVPAAVSQSLTVAYVQAEDYISNYNIYMHHLLDDNGDRLFPKGLKLITHWGLRDELKAQYAKTDGLPCQQMIQTVMERIVTQQIPQKVINNDQVDWNPLRNKVYKNGAEIKFEPEGDTRYQRLLDIFHAEQAADPYYPLMPTKIDRRFKKDREIPEADFEKLIVSVLTDPVVKDVANLISKRLNRKLQPFDIWYNGFKQRGSIDETQLDKIVSERYPDVQAFQNDIPNILKSLGFADSTAAYLSTKITVDPSRGAGHAMGAERRPDNAHLRTRIAKGGMKYKGFNIAIHELGHNVEQVFSLNKIDYYSLHSVPNTAFTEAFAFVFQSRDLDVLGMGRNDEMAQNLKTLDTYWSTCEIAAVGLVDMRVWHWMYDHPDATAEELKGAVIEISKDVWNSYFAPFFGIKDSILLGVYSHMIESGMYIPDYSLGFIIMFQIEQYLKDRNLGTEMERMCRTGSITPDAWMRAAVGGPVSAQPLLDATREAVKMVKTKL
ncbi:MAG: hypothetical protein GWP06_17185 [Actinobacteria bacterium]|nr:hypothetical protein [Actinomycetota bacterium]